MTRGSIHKRGQTWTVVYDEPSPDGKRRQRVQGRVPDTQGGSGVPDRAARADRRRHLLGAGEAHGWRVPDDRVAPGRRGHAAPAERHEVPLRRSGSTSSRPSAPCGCRRSPPAHLNALYADLERDGLSVSTRRLVHAVIGRALRDAERWGRVTRNVARMADPPARGGSRATAWTASELRRFLDHVAGGSAVRVVAAGGDNRDAPRRARRRDVARARSGRCPAVDRAAARSDPWRRHVRPAEVGQVAADGRARRRDRSGDPGSPRHAAARA